ncbi:MAG: divalent cation tolerance protein CutA [Candidatus Coatesbacteria bacterium]|nr:divalent cation tolerance protein CutA [Candidatus Coatesbacteria bacterium]
MRHADYLMVYVTCASPEQAQRLADNLVGERLAACANILPGMRAVYRWRGAVERDEETVLLLKTTAVRLERLVARAVELHSYEVPCVVALPLVGGHADYLEWIENATEERS